MAMTKEEVAEVVRAWCNAWHTRNVETLVAMEAQAFGFGFRPFAPRDHVAEGQAAQRERLRRWFGSLDSYSLVPEDFETSVAGDVGMAWGTFIEKWQDKGHLSRDDKSCEQLVAESARCCWERRRLACVPSKSRLRMAAWVATHCQLECETSQIKDNRLNRLGSDSLPCLSKEHKAGRCYCTTATFSLLLTMDATPRRSQ